MGLFDTLSKVGAAVSNVVENAANEYKEKKAYEAAESEMKMSINEDLNEYAESRIMALDYKTAELVMSLEILIYDSFKKEGYADSVDLLGAIATECNIDEWASEYKNSETLKRAYEAFYKSYYMEALETSWYKDAMAPFYGEESIVKLVQALNLMMIYYIGDLAEEVCEKEFGEENVVWNMLSQKQFDFWDPLVAYFMNSDDDMDMTTNLDKYEKKCFKRYKNVSLYLLAINAGMGDADGDLKHVYLKDGEPVFIDVVNDSLVYISAEYPSITKIAQLKTLSGVKPNVIKFEDIVYWKQTGEKRTEVGLKEPSAVVALYAATKGVVAPRRLEEREIDTREIELATSTRKMHFEFSSHDVFEKLIPQFEYDRVALRR